VISVSGVSKSHHGKPVLVRASLEVPAKTCVALIGPSGCGKSTLLRLVLGLLLPDEGTITVAGQPVTPATCRAVRLRAGYVLQDGGLFPHLSAEGNVTLMARYLGWEPARARSRVDELAALVGLAPEMLARFPAQLSGGQRQRVGIMRALLLDPDVLLMDEPLGALDPMLRARVQKDLRALFARLAKSVLLVTHDMAEAAYLGDIIAIMKDGRVLQTGSFRDLVERPLDPFVTDFIAAQRPAPLDEPRAGTA
jgi:osmoprotectant transport system ATP-binding protein